ncbi:hypothetical protein [Pseudomonas sp. H9]|uniref:hypothetical protein n=1 Tax=Pseudomonas sp. H9 TaxID=483968 RepID=UPI0021142BD0|nr:hypothetical protein [Pseudomonas sp. H9]
MQTLKATAKALREYLEALEDKNPDAKAMLNILRDLLLKAEGDEIQTPMEPKGIPGYRYLPETNLQDDRELSELFASFYMALIDGQEWSFFKKFQAKYKKCETPNFDK